VVLMNEERLLVFDRCHVFINEADVPQCDMCNIVLNIVLKEKKYVCSLTRQFYCFMCNRKTKRQACRKLLNKSVNYHDHFIVMSIQHITPRDYIN